MRKRIRLGFNIDHVATVRNARGDDYPSPINAAIIAQKNGADSITVHNYSAKKRRRFNYSSSARRSKTHSRS